MKKILITGENSYIGRNFENWISCYPEQFQVTKISLRDDEWKSIDFSLYDVVLHVAGIAHVSRDPKLKDQYYRVNRDLTLEVALQAKEAGIEQFIFLSSIIVYGDQKINKGRIDRQTLPKPSDFYGDSKLQAEKGILQLEDDNFRIAIVRPPMVYGKDSKGNFARLARFARSVPMFPKYENKRSMIYIKNLCEFLRILILVKGKGIFFPQNKEWVNITSLVVEIAKNRNKKIYVTKLGNSIINKLTSKYDIFHKIFGDLYYSYELSEINDISNNDYRVKSFSESIKETEQRALL